MRVAKMSADHDNQLEKNAIAKAKSTNEKMDTLTGCYAVL